MHNAEENVYARQEKMDKILSESCYHAINVAISKWNAFPIKRLGLYEDFKIECPRLNELGFFFDECLKKNLISGMANNSNSNNNMIGSRTIWIQSKTHVISSSNRGSSIPHLSFSGVSELLGSLLPSEWTLDRELPLGLRLRCSGSQLSDGPSGFFACCCCWAELRRRMLLGFLNAAGRASLSLRPLSRQPFFFTRPPASIEFLLLLFIFSFEQLGKRSRNRLHHCIRNM